MQNPAHPARGSARPVVGVRYSELCVGYVMVGMAELCFAELCFADDLVNPLPSYERKHRTMFDANDVWLPLTWKNIPALAATKPVVVPPIFRDALCSPGARNCAIEFGRRHNSFRAWTPCCSGSVRRKILPSLASSVVVPLHCS
eukprot:COSAG02_NODE_130_length_34758_cov_80.817767_13_plen_144_part_00